MNASDVAALALERGQECPYDAPDAWHGSGEPPPPPLDWAVAAARGVVADLRDRRGIKWGFENVDEDVRAEIIDALAAIIRLARETP